MSFLDELVKKGIIKEEELPELSKLISGKYKGDVDTALLAFGLDEKILLKAKSEYFNIPIKPIDPKSISFDILRYIPEDAAKYYKFVPIGIVDGILEVGIVDPENIQANDALQFITAKLNTPYKYFLISQSDFDLILRNYKGITGEVDAVINELDAEISSADTKNVLIENTNPQDALKPGEEERIVEDAPIIKIVAVILRHATEGNASDIHIENTGEQVKVRFRVDGQLHTSLLLPLNVYAGIVARIKILAKLRLDEKRKPQDGGFSTKIDGHKIDFRVSTLPTYFGEKVEMRILDSDKGVKPLDQLGLSKENLDLIREAIALPYGLILMTGPTGSGKSTTLYSMLNELNREKRNIVSLEDPVEYHIPDMSQSQVLPEIGYTFASGLRSILRQDPDVIMVGEIRDKETAQLAIQAALTGHLVFSTLHTNNAVGVIPRLIDMGVDPYLIAPTLVLAIAQRLVRTICPTSRHEIPIDEATAAMIDKQFSDLPPEFKSRLPLGKTMYEAVPSSECPSGVRGRMAVFEIIKVDKDLKHVILSIPNEQDIYKVARANGMLTMREDAILKGISGLVPFQDVYGL